MWTTKNLFHLLRRENIELFQSNKLFSLRSYYGVPFLDFYQKTTGDKPSNDFLEKIRKKHPGIDTLSHEHLQSTLKILKKFDISATDACLDPHIFTMKLINMENYGDILTECGFVTVRPKHIIRYHTLVKSRTISWLKKENLIRESLILEELLHKCFKKWEFSHKPFQNFPDSSTNIVTVRMSVLQKYLNWRLGVTEDEFSKYCKYYLPMRHRPMADIQEALDIAQYNIQYDTAGIRRNGFIISADPINTKLILENVQHLASVDIREALRIEPAILKNNHIAILQIRDLLQKYEIPEEAQRKCFKVYCMRPDTVKERLDDLCIMKEYQVLKTNPRILSMVVHQKKMLNRLEKIQTAKKQCFSLNHLIGSNKIFNNYISNFGDKVCSRDLAVLISSSLSVDTDDNKKQPVDAKLILKQMKRHKFWLHAALHVIDDNLQFLKKRVSDDVILNNCQLLLYPTAEIETYIDYLTRLREGNREQPKDKTTDASFQNLNHKSINDDQILSLVLYEIEKKYHFSGDGIWSKQDGSRVEAHAR